MTVATLELPAYVYDPEDIKITVVDNRRYTMRDIGKIEDRVEKFRSCYIVKFIRIRYKNFSNTRC